MKKKRRMRKPRNKMMKIIQMMLRRNMNMIIKMREMMMKKEGNQSISPQEKTEDETEQPQVDVVEQKLVAEGSSKVEEMIWILHS